MLQRNVLIDLLCFCFPCETSLWLGEISVLAPNFFFFIWKNSAFMDHGDLLNRRGRRRCFHPFPRPVETWLEIHMHQRNLPEAFFRRHLRIGRESFDNLLTMLMENGGKWGHVRNTVEPRSTDTRLIRTPRYYGQFRWSRRKPHTFSLKLTHLIRTPVNTDNGHFSVSRVTNSYTLSTPLYGHYLSVHCEFSLSRLFANLKTLDPGQMMTEFEELKPFYYKEKLNSVTSGV